IFIKLTLSLLLCWAKTISRIPHGTFNFFSDTFSVHIDSLPFREYFLVGIKNLPEKINHFYILTFYCFLNSGTYRLNNLFIVKHGCSVSILSNKFWATFISNKKLARHQCATAS